MCRADSCSPCHSCHPGASHPGWSVRSPDLLILTITTSKCPQVPTQVPECALGCPPFPLPDPQLGPPRSTSPPNSLTWAWHLQKPLRTGTTCLLRAACPTLRDCALRVEPHRTCFGKAHTRSFFPFYESSSHTPETEASLCQALQGQQQPLLSSGFAI